MLQTMERTTTPVGFITKLISDETRKELSSLVKTMFNVDLSFNKSSDSTVENITINEDSSKECQNAVKWYLYGFLASKGYKES